MPNDAQRRVLDATGRDRGTWLVPRRSGAEPRRAREALSRVAAKFTALPCDSRRDAHEAGRLLQEVVTRGAGIRSTQRKAVSRSIARTARNPQLGHPLHKTGVRAAKICSRSPPGLARAATR
jgi:hypothetical protein